MVASRAQQAWLARQSVAAGEFQKAFVRWDLVWGPCCCCAGAGMGEAAVGVKCPRAPQQRTVSKYTKGSMRRLNAPIFADAAHPHSDAFTRLR